MAAHTTTRLTFRRRPRENYEMLVYDHVLTSGERADVYTYLQDRWATLNGL